MGGGWIYGRNGEKTAVMPVYGECDAKKCVWGLDIYGGPVLLLVYENGRYPPPPAPDSNASNNSSGS